MMAADDMEGRRVEFAGAGPTLVADVAGPEDGPPILFLHGSGQTRATWSGALGEAARRGYRGVAIDMRGHGDSGWSPDGVYRLATFVDDARAVMGRLGPAPAIVGASLGGMAAMTIAGEDPAGVGALVLVDITTRVEAEGAREVVTFMRSGEQGFASLDEAADAVAAYLPNRPRPAHTGGLLRNLRRRGDRYYWHWDPAFMTMGDTPDAARMPDALADAARRIACPVLLLRGARSRILSEAGVREFRALVPHADYVDIAGADHMVAGDASDAFNAAMFAFLDRTVGVAGGGGRQGA